MFLSAIFSFAKAIDSRPQWEKEMEQILVKLDARVKEMALIGSDRTQDRLVLMAQSSESLQEKLTLLETELKDLDIELEKEKCASVPEDETWHALSKKVQVGKEIIQSTEQRVHIFMDKLGQVEENLQMLDESLKKLQKEQDELDAKQKDANLKRRELNEALEHYQNELKNASGSFCTELQVETKKNASRLKTIEEKIESLHRKLSLCEAENALALSRSSFATTHHQQVKTARQKAFEEQSTLEQDIIKLRNSLTAEKSSFLETAKELELLDSAKRRKEDFFNLKLSRKEKILKSIHDLEVGSFEIKMHASQMEQDSHIREHKFSALEKSISVAEDEFLHFARRLLLGVKDFEFEAFLTNFLVICKNYHAPQRLLDELVAEVHVERKSLRNFEIPASDNSVFINPVARVICVQGGPLITGKLSISSFLLLFDVDQVEKYAYSLCFKIEDFVQASLLSAKTIDAKVRKAVNVLDFNSKLNCDHENVLFVNSEDRFLQGRVDLQRQSHRPLDQNTLVDVRRVLSDPPYGPNGKKLHSMKELEAVLLIELDPTRLIQRSDMWENTICFLGLLSELSIIHFVLNQCIIERGKLDPAIAGNKTLLVSGRKEINHEPVCVDSLKQFDTQKILEVVVIGDSECLDVMQLKTLIFATPTRFRVNSWRLLYSMSKHGVSWKTFFSKATDIRGTVLIIRDQGARVFGFFNAEPWKISTSFYGSGESFVYSFNPNFVKHSWTSENSFFVLSSTVELSIGGGMNYAIHVDKDIMNGMSGRSSTFNNPVLSSTIHFQVNLLELWGCD